MEVEIEKYSKKGHGIGLIQKAPKSAPEKVEVMGGVIGDRLKIALGKKKNGCYQGSILDIIKPSSQRITPRCRHALSCGGCSWQQVDYPSQLKLKEDLLHSLFSPYLSQATYHPIIPCEDPWRYRNKMEFSFSQDKEGNRFVGLIQSQSKGKVLNLQECHLAPSWMIELLSELRVWWEESGLKAYHTYSDAGTLRTLTLREGKRTNRKMVILTVSGNQDHFLKKNHIKSFTQAVEKVLTDEPSIYLRIHRIEKGRPSEFYEMNLSGREYLLETLHIHDRTFNFHISPSSFFQPNTLQAEKLYRRALELSLPTPSMTVYDLYAGTSTLGILFAPFVKKVISVELNPYAVCDAKLNVEENKLSNIQIIKGDVGKILQAIRVSPDLVILDPPRSGLDKAALSHLIRIKPKKILYISCNPMTQVQNISSLIDGGFRLSALQGVDQFPHTTHLENIALLE